VSCGMYYSKTCLNWTLSKLKTCLSQTDFTVPSTKCLCNLNMRKPNNCLNWTNSSVPKGYGLDRFLLYMAFAWFYQRLGVKTWQDKVETLTHSFDNSANTEENVTQGGDQAAKNVITHVILLSLCSSSCNTKIHIQSNLQICQVTVKPGHLY